MYQEIMIDIDIDNIDTVKTMKLQIKNIFDLLLQIT